MTATLRTLAIVLAVAIAGRAVRAGWSSWLRGRRDAALVAALPGLLERVAAELRSGGSVLSALHAAAAAPGPLAGQIAAVLAGAAEGTSLVSALAAWRDQHPLPPLRAATGALEVAAVTGGRSAAALEGLAAGLADRLALHNEAAALSAQARLSAVVVGLAPLGSLALSAAVDGRVPRALFATGPGRACLVAGLGLDLVAAAWMRRILRLVDR